MRMNPKLGLRLFGVTIFVAAVSTLVASSAGATPGVLDPAFGTGGRVETDFNPADRDGVQELLVLPGGKLIAVGFSTIGGRLAIALARYEPGGTLDPDFGVGGKVITEGPGAAAVGAALQSDGKILVVGPVPSFAGRGALVRYEADGSLDASFGAGGFVFADVPMADVAVEPSGMIVVAGAAGTSESPGQAVVLRFNNNGEPDTSFGDSGRAAINIPGGDSGIRAVSLQQDRKIVIAGRTFLGGPGYHFLLARFTSDGSVDESFGTAGTVVTPSANGAFDVLAQADGILAVGDVFGESGSGAMAVFRYNLSGSLDASFGNSGVAQADPGPSSDRASAVTLDDQGMIIVAGSAFFDSSSHDYALARFHGDGRLDRTFGTSGVATVDFGGSDGGEAVVLQAGKLVIAGEARLGEFGLARFEGGPPVDGTPPVINVPAPITIVASTGEGEVVTYEATAVDAVDPAPTVVCEPPSGSHFPLGETTVSCAATDASGNSSTATFTVTVLEPFALGLTLDRASANPRSGVATLRVAVACNRNTNFMFLLVHLEQTVARRATLTADAGTNGDCLAPGSTRVFELTAPNGRFAPGLATVSMFVNACDGFVCSQISRTTNVVLTAKERSRFS